MLAKGHEDDKKTTAHVIRQLSLSLSAAPSTPHAPPPVLFYFFYIWKTVSGFDISNPGKNTVGFRFPAEALINL